MAISEQLQNRIANLTGSMDPGFSVSPPPMSPEQQAMAKRMSEQFMATPPPMLPEQEAMAKRMGEQFSVSPEDLICLLYTSPSPRDGLLSRMPSSA